jgi:hypothetical protein
MLDTDLVKGNIHVKISDITGPMVAALPPVATDLVDLASYMYCADQATSRGGEKELEYGEKFRRRFRFEMPVRCPETWGDKSVSEQLCKTLGRLPEGRVITDKEHDELVTLTQIAALVFLAKRTHERYVKQGKIPESDFRGGDGKANKWYWKPVRPALSKLSKRNMPERFSGSQII